MPDQEAPPLSEQLALIEATQNKLMASLDAIDPKQSAVDLHELTTACDRLLVFAHAFLDLAKKAGEAADSILRHSGIEE
jgi:hypothetical protein